MSNARWSRPPTTTIRPNSSAPRARADGRRTPCAATPCACHGRPHHGRRSHAHQQPVRGIGGPCRISPTVGRNAQGNLVEGVWRAPAARPWPSCCPGAALRRWTSGSRERQAQGKAALAPVQAAEGRHIDVLLFSRQMHTLLKAGVPIMRALAGLQESATNRAMPRSSRPMREASIPAASCRWRWRAPEGVRPFYVAMVRVGETTGMLDEIFLRLFDHLEFERSCASRSSRRCATRCSW
jgi:hypothetical protein